MSVNSRRWIRRTGILFAAAVLAPTVLLLMLYIPSIQQAVKQQATQWLTGQTGMEVHIERIRLCFPLRLELQGVRIGSQLTVAHLSTDIQPYPLIQGTIKANYMRADHINIHTGSPLAGTTEVAVGHLSSSGLTYAWRERKATIHDILLSEGNIAVHSIAPDRSAPSIPIRLPIAVSVSGIRLHDIATTYTNTSLQLSATASDLILHDIAADTTVQVSLKKLNLSDGKLTLQQGHTAPITLTALALQADSLRYAPQALTGHLTRLTFTGPHDLQLRKGAMSFAWHAGMLALPHFTFHTAHSDLSGHLRTIILSGGTHIDGNLKALVGHSDIRLLSQWGTPMVRQLAIGYPSEPLSITLAVNGPMEQLRLSQCTASLPTAFDINLNGTAYHITDPRQRQLACRFEGHTYDLSFLTALTADTAAQHLHIPDSIAWQGNLHYAPDTLHTLCTLALAYERVAIESSYRPSSQRYMLRLQTDSLDLHRFVPDGDLGMISLQAHLSGNRFAPLHPTTTLQGGIQLHMLQWQSHTFTNARAEVALADRQLRIEASCRDTLMQWSLSAAAKYTSDVLDAHVDAQLHELDMRALQMSDIPISPTFQCHAAFSVDSAATYRLQGQFSDIVLRTPTQTIQPCAIALQASLQTDTLSIAIRSGDLTFAAHAHTGAAPRLWQHPIREQGTARDYLSGLRIALTAGTDNPIAHYIALQGVQMKTLHATVTEQEGLLRGSLTIDSLRTPSITTPRLSVAAHHIGHTLHATLQAMELAWHTPSIDVRGSANGTIVWGGAFNPDSLSGMLRLTALQCAIPTYSLYLHAADTLAVTLQGGTLHLDAIPLYPAGKQPLLLSGSISPFSDTPSVQLQLSARNVSLLQPAPTRKSLLHGKAFVNANIALNGPLSALTLTGSLHLLPGSSIHYTYKDAILTANNQLSNIVTFVDFNTEPPRTTHSKPHLTASSLTMDLIVNITPTAQVGVTLGTSKQNFIKLQGGGALNVQHTAAGGLRLAGRYTITTGELNLNVPLLHVSHMTIRTGSTITWSGNARNPQFDVTAEERIRASVTLDGSPQSILFTAGLSVTNTLEKLNIQFTLSAPENATMQNTLSTLSAEERSKLSAALLTTGLYLGEGGTGNLMNTALMGILQSQLDNISRDAFRTIDVSVGIDALPDGVSGISTRTDYSFSVAKRLWNDRIRIVIGGSVTTNNERIEEDAVIDNISIEWRITPTGSQYLRFFYDKHYESILEGEIRETGIGYAYRRSLYRLGKQSK